MRENIRLLVKDKEPIYAILPSQATPAHHIIRIQTSIQTFSNTNYNRNYSVNFSLYQLYESLKKVRLNIVIYVDVVHWKTI